MAVDNVKTMEVRELTPHEHSTLVHAVAHLKEDVLYRMAKAAGDHEVAQLRALLADHDTCVTLSQLVAPPCRLKVRV